MGIKEKIIEALTGNTLSVKTLAGKLSITESDARVYIKRIKDSDKKNGIVRLKEVETKDRYKFYTIEKKSYESNMANRVLQDKADNYGKLIELIESEFLVVDPKKVKGKEDDRLQWLSSLS